jgi:hypothetical protein
MGGTALAMRKRSSGRRAAEVRRGGLRSTRLLRSAVLQLARVWDVDRRGPSAIWQNSRSALGECAFVWDLVLLLKYCRLAQIWLGNRSCQCSRPIA